jgi:acetyl esterase
MTRLARFRARIADTRARIADARARIADARYRMSQAATDRTWYAAAHATKRLPIARPERHGLVRLDDVAYTSSSLAAHTLDVYRPRAAHGPLPVVLYLHGGGFRILSKDSHWMMGLAFARRGFVVFNANYRLAPANPFPAAIEDACHALAWVGAHAREHGGDPDRVVLAGESAGANLVLSLAIATSWPRAEPYARAAYDANVRIRAALPACGLLQVTDSARFARRKRLSAFVRDRLHEVEHAYLPASAPRERDLADPLVFLERAERAPRPLPPMFAGVGTADPVLDDTRRLKVALDRAGVACETRYYPGELHAFHAVMITPHARAYWRDAFAFLDRHGVR